MLTITKSEYDLLDQEDKARFTKVESETQMTTIYEIESLVKSQEIDMGFFDGLKKLNELTIRAHRDLLAKLADSGCILYTEPESYMVLEADIFSIHLICYAELT